MKYRIDINADLGEGMGNDEALMPYISSCSIASGGHIGDEESMRTTVRLAKEHGVKVGAHPSFPDRDNFGRKILSMTKSELKESVYFQLLRFYAVCETEEVEVNHIKLHGALYNYAGVNAAAADAVVDAITETTVRPYVYLQHGSVLHRKAENLLPLKFEAFIDRGYDASGQLVPRSGNDALIEDPEQAWNQLYRMVTDKSVFSVGGDVVPIIADTFCIHGDHPGCKQIITFISKRMKDHNIELI